MWWRLVLLGVVLVVAFPAALAQHPLSADEATALLRTGMFRGGQDFVVQVQDSYAYPGGTDRPWRAIARVDADAKVAYWGVDETSDEPSLVVDYELGAMWTPDGSETPQWTVQRTGLRTPHPLFLEPVRTRGATLGLTTPEGEWVSLVFDGTTLTGFHLGGDEYRLVAANVHQELGVAGLRSPVCIEHDFPTEGLHDVRIHAPVDLGHRALRLEYSTEDDGILWIADWSEGVPAIDFVWDDADGDGRVNKGDAYSYILGPGEGLRILDNAVDQPVCDPARSQPAMPRGNHRAFSVIPALPLGTVAAAFLIAAAAASRR